MTQPIALVPPAKPNPRLVRTCAELLELAKAGRLRGLAIVMVMTGDEVGYCYRGVREPYRILGVLEHLKRCVLRTIDQDGNEVVYEDDPGGRDAEAGRDP